MVIAILWHGPSASRASALSAPQFSSPPFQAMMKSFTDQQGQYLAFIWSPGGSGGL
jgi:hypothetical protein